MNAKSRKFRFEAYTVVTGYPREVPKIKVASIKHAYKQETTRGWCQLPQSISHRLDKDSKFNMKIFMEDLDEVLCWMTKAAKVLIKEGANALNARTKWIAEVDVGIMNRIYEVPKQKEGMTVADQQAELAEECAGFFAKKLVALKGHVQSLSAVADGDVAKFLAGVPEIGQIPDQDTGVELAKKIQTHLEKPTDANSAVAAEGKEKQLLKPTALQMDASGRPISEHEVRLSSKSTSVEVIDWTQWCKHTWKSIM